MDAWKQYFIPPPAPSWSEFLSYIREEVYRHRSVSDFDLRDDGYRMVLTVNWNIDEPLIHIPDRFKSHVRLESRRKDSVNRITYDVLDGQFDKTFVGQTFRTGQIEITWIG